MLQEKEQKAYELGYEYEKNYGGCAQCVVAALQDVYDIRDEALFKSASGLAGGIGLLGNGACGAYIGGVMFLSYFKGRERDNFADENGIRFESFALARELHKCLIDRYGSITCRDIQAKIMKRSYFLADPEERKRYIADGGHDDKCTDVCGFAAKCVVMIAEKYNL